MGLVAYSGRWQRPEAVADALRADVKHADLLAEYDGRRGPEAASSRRPVEAGALVRGERPEGRGRAPLHAVVRLDPAREAPGRGSATRRPAPLGHRRPGRRREGRGRGPEAGRQEVAAAPGAAPRGARPRPAKRRGRGRAGAVTDPRAVPSVWHGLRERAASHQVEAVQLLGQIDSPRRRGRWRRWPSPASGRGPPRGRRDAPAPRPPRVGRPR